MAPGPIVPKKLSSSTTVALSGQVPSLRQPAYRILTCRPNSVIKNKNRQMCGKGRHTTARRGRNFFSRPPSTRPFHTLLSPASQTSGRSRAPGSSSKFSNLTREIGGAWPRREAAVGVVHRARRAAKCSGPGWGRCACARRWAKVDGGC